MLTALLAVAFIGGTIVFGVAGVALGRKTVHGKVVEGHNEALVPLFLNAGVLYAVLLGFMIVGVWESYAETHATAVEEGATLVPLYRQTTNMDPDKRDEMRKNLREYADTIVKEEWPQMAVNGQPILKAQKIIGNIYDTFGTLTPSTPIKQIVDAEFMRTMSQELVLRNKRLLQASESLYWVMWLGAVGGAFIVIGMSFLLYMESPAPQLIMTAIMSGLIGMLLFMLFVLSHPFNGPLAIDPVGFEASLATFNAVDQGGQNAGNNNQ